MANNFTDDINSDIYYCCDIQSFHDSYICPYAHVTNELDLIKIDVRRIICPFDLGKGCRYKNSCMFAHLNDYESEEDSEDEEEVVQEEQSLYQDRLDNDSLDETTASENLDEHLIQRERSDSVNSNSGIAEELEHILSFAENQESEKAYSYDTKLKPKANIDESYFPAKESLQNSNESDTVSHFSDKTFFENRNSSLASTAAITSNTSPTAEANTSPTAKANNSPKAKANTSRPTEDTSVSNQNSILNAVGATSTSIKFPKSAMEREISEFAKDELEEEIHNPIKCDTFLNSATNESSQNSLSDVEIIASTSQPVNNANELKPNSIVSITPTCGICHEPIESTEPGRNAARFGILPNCNHPFCLNCIIKWRDQGRKYIIIEVDPSNELWHDSESFDSFEEAQEAMLNTVDAETARSCPLCRKLSYFVVPSCHWVKNDTEKDELIAKYKAKLYKRHCKYYRSKGECKFGKYCFYLHSAFYCKVLRSKYNFY